MKLKRKLNKFKWNMKNLYLKNEHKIIPILNFMKYILIIAFILFSYMYILYMRMLYMYMLYICIL